MLCYEHIYKLMVHKQRSMVRTMVAHHYNALHWWVLGPVKPNFVFHMLLFKHGHLGPENFLFFRWYNTKWCPCKKCWRNKWGCKCREAWVGCRTMQRGTAALTAEWIMLRTSLSSIVRIEHFHIHLLYQKGHMSLYYHILYIWSVLIYSQVQMSGPWWLIPMLEDAINSALEIFSQLSPFSWRDRCCRFEGTTAPLPDCRRCEEKERERARCH